MIMSKPFIIVAGLICLGVNSIYAQPGKTSTTQPVKPAPKTSPVLKTTSDSVSYAIGVSVANYYQQLGITKLNTTQVSKGINDKLGGKKPLLDDVTINKLMTDYINRIQEQKAKVHITEGQKFLAKNKLRPEVKTTASGLQYEVLIEGTGAKPSSVTDTATCHYKGAFVNGTVFESSYNTGQPIRLALNQVIPGWTEGLMLMSVGSKYKFYIPYNLAYGPADYQDIPGGSTLVFEIELLDLKKQQ